MLYFPMKNMTIYPFGNSFYALLQNLLPIIKIYSELHKAEYLIYHMNSTPDILPQQKEEHIGHIINQIRK